MTRQEKKTNEQFFNIVIMMATTYLYPDANEAYVIVNNRMHGTKRGIEIIKNITTKDFHHKLVIQK